MRFFPSERNLHQHFQLLLTGIGWSTKLQPPVFIIFLPVRYLLFGCNFCSYSLLCIPHVKKQIIKSCTTLINDPFFELLVSMFLFSIVFTLFLTRSFSSDCIHTHTHVYVHIHKYVFYYIKFVLTVYFVRFVSIFQSFQFMILQFMHFLYPSNKC